MDAIIEAIIEAYPRKKLFIDILTKDVDAEACILDLIDNSVDSYIMKDIQGRRSIYLSLSKEKFEIRDTCGGIELNYLKKHVFMFGAESLKREKPTLGFYGIGLKRSIFKLGNRINMTTDDGINRSVIDLVERPIFNVA
ncbi:MAG: ATP-binding protein [Candidatus Cloacimonadaceae bacterium]|nr:ATP-binding protein [Candidatus Cloacimonadaceae bacterium]